MDFYHISSLNLPSGHLTSPCTAAKNDRMFRRILVVLSAVCLGKQSEVKIYSYHKKCQMLPLFGKINIACCSREALHRGLSCKGRILRGSNLKQETFWVLSNLFSYLISAAVIQFLLFSFKMLQRNSPAEDRTWSSSYRFISGQLF